MTMMSSENIFRILNNTLKLIVHRRFRLHRSSYFIHKLVVPLFLLVFCIGSSLTAHVSSPNRHDHDHDSLPSPSPTETRRDLKDLSGSSLDATVPIKGLFFGEDTNGVPIVIGTWFRYGSYTLAFALFGTVFLTACAATAVYYTLFVVTEPSQQERSSKIQSSPSLTLDGWNLPRVLRALHLAYETYETFDPYNASCQLKTVCEIQESAHFQGSLLKRLVHFLIHSELVQKKLENAEELKAAARVGNDPGEACIEKYSECRFSLNRLYERYVKL